jgi:hypothetical protein
MMSARTKFRSARTLRSMILAWNVLCSSSVLWWTLRWELITDMILQKNQQEFLPKIIHKKNILVRVTKIWQNNSSKKDFCKNKDREYHN